MLVTVKIAKIFLLWFILWVGSTKCITAHPHLHIYCFFLLHYYFIMVKTRMCCMFVEQKQPRLLVEGFFFFFLVVFSHGVLCNCLAPQLCSLVSLRWVNDEEEYLLCW